MCLRLFIRVPRCPSLWCQPVVLFCVYLCLSHVCTWARTSAGVPLVCVTALCVPASSCVCLHVCLCVCPCRPVVCERRLWVEFGPGMCLVWLSQYFQRLEPTFKNQDISHKNSAFQFLLKIQKPWQPWARAPMRPLSHGAAQGPPAARLAPQRLGDDWVCDPGCAGECVCWRDLSLRGGGVCADLCMCGCVCARHVRGCIRDHVQRVGHRGLAHPVQGPLPAFEGGSDSRLLAGPPCGIYFCLGAHRRPE